MEGREMGEELRADSFGLEWRKRKAELLAKHPERRDFSTTDFELREAPNGILRFSGYASVTETPYEVGFYTETIQRGAFKRTLSESPDVQLLINHGEGGSGMPIARTGRNMTLSEDDHGLRVDAELDAEDPDVALLARKMKNGLIDQMSFAFQATDQSWNEEYTERSIRAASIHRGDVSVVNQGANGASKGAIRSREAAKAVRHLGLERFLSMVDEIGQFRALGAEKRPGDDAKEAFTTVLGLFSRDSDDSEGEIQALVKDFLGVKMVPTEAEPAADLAVSEPPDDLRAVRRRRQDQLRRAQALRRSK